MSRHRSAPTSLVLLAALALGGCIAQPAPIAEAERPDGGAAPEDARVLPEDGPLAPDPRAPACLVFEPLQLEIGLGSPGQGQDLEASLRNCGDVPLTLTEGRILPEQQFNWNLGTDLEGLVLAPRAEIPVRLSHLTTGAARDEATLEVSAEGEGEAVQARLALVATPRLGDCLPELVRTDVPMGALTVTPDGHAFVVSSEPTFSGWRLGEIELNRPDLVARLTVEDGHQSEVRANWIERRGAEIRVYEIFPDPGYHIFDRATGRAGLQEGAPPSNTPPPHEFDGALWTLHIGQGDDGCGNVCIRREQPGADAEMWFDDADHDYAIHTGHIFFFEDHAYLMTYNRPGSAYLRLSLRTGEVEVLYAFPPGADLAWIKPPTVHDGLLYWLREEQIAGTSTESVDRFDPRAGALTLELVRGLTAGADGLRIVGERLVWYASDGIYAAPLNGGPVTELLRDGNSTPTYMDVFADRLYFTREYVFGCVLLAR